MGMLRMTSIRCATGLALAAALVLPFACSDSGSPAETPPVRAVAGTQPAPQLYDPRDIPHHAVYVIDRCGSMLAQFDEVRMAVLQSVARMRPTQSFHIVLFASGGGRVPEGPAKGLVPATAENKRAAVRFMKAVTGGATYGLPSLKRAFQVLARADPKKPGKVIYLLTDGDFSGLSAGGTHTYRASDGRVLAGNEAVIQWLRDHNKDKSVRIDTVLYLHKTPSAAKALRTIAADSGGRYKYVSEDGPVSFGSTTRPAPAAAPSRASTRPVRPARAADLEWPLVREGRYVRWAGRVWNTRKPERIWQAGDVGILAQRNGTATLLGEGSVNAGSVSLEVRFDAGYLAPAGGGKHFLEIMSWVADRSDRKAVNKRPWSRIELANLGDRPRCIVWNYGKGFRGRATKIVRVGPAFKPDHWYRIGMDWSYNPPTGRVTVRIDDRTYETDYEFVADTVGPGRFFLFGHVETVSPEGRLHFRNFRVARAGAARAVKLPRTALAD